MAKIFTIKNLGIVLGFGALSFVSTRYALTPSKVPVTQYVKTKLDEDENLDAVVRLRDDISFPFLNRNGKYVNPKNERKREIEQAGTEYNSVIEKINTRYDSLIKRLE